jgi:hypothetical protein
MAGDARSELEPALLHVPLPDLTWPQLIVEKSRVRPTRFLDRKRCINRMTQIPYRHGTMRDTGYRTAGKPAGGIVDQDRVHNPCHVPIGHGSMIGRKR